ncbi:GDSL-type esterase/lipase family protein, partial [Leucobacter sp. M11]|uniref:GDSL-type esterase/lipase family protein n=1 Tax=Leucobacter sp. M11 TaxID=2993565 RepID=UPI002D7ED76A
TFNGGGNDMLRPGTDLPEIIARTEAALRRIMASGAETVLVAGANPTGGLPLGSRVARKGDALARAAGELASRLGIRFADNWTDPELAGPQYWSVDRLHLNPIGHQRVAANVLAALGRPAPGGWETQAPAPGRAPSFVENARFAREHVAPWVKRRLTGRSSGDGRLPKYGEWTVIEPR